MIHMFFIIQPSAKLFLTMHKIETKNKRIVKMVGSTAYQLFWVIQSQIVYIYIYIYMTGPLA